MAGEPNDLARHRLGPARRAMRDATRELHERMHALPRLRRLAEGRIGQAEYAALLVDFLRFHRVIEDRLSRGPDLMPLGIDVACRRRSPHLEDDLGALGCRVPDSAATPDCGLAVPASVPAALGYLYVVEGARLGGRVLARALDAAQPPLPAVGRRYLLGEGPAVRNGWGELCDALERVGSTRAAQAAMISAAKAAFAAFEACVAP